MARRKAIPKEVPPELVWALKSLGRGALSSASRRTGLPLTTLSAIKSGRIKSSRVTEGLANALGVEKPPRTVRLPKDKVIEERVAAAVYLGTEVSQRIRAASVQLDRVMAALLSEKWALAAEEGCGLAQSAEQLKEISEDLFGCAEVLHRKPPLPYLR